MRKASRLAVALMCSAMFVLLGQGVPQITSLDPLTAKAGDVITATGTSLDKASVSKVFVTDGKIDMPAVIAEQTDVAIKFKLPAMIKPGRYGLMVEAAKDKRQIDQPVRFSVE